MIQPTTPVIAALFAQFRNQHPSGGLATELLMLHENQYIVRATVTLDGVVIATAMATDADLEKAEKHSQVKVLNLMGIPTTPTPLANPAINILPPFEPSPAEPPPTPPDDKPIADEADPLDVISDGDISSQAPLPSTLPDEDEVLDMPLDEVAEISLLSVEPLSPEPYGPSVPGQPASSLAASAIETLNNSTSPVDLSDIIAQTDVEMARLGWSSRQGREYLERTYSKRSRQQLTDEELLAFLLHLESQPTPSVR